MKTSRGQTSTTGLPTPPTLLQTAPGALAHALLQAMRTSADVAPELHARFLAAVLDFEGGFIDAEGFAQRLGLFAASATATQRKKRFRLRLVPILVDAARRRGLPKNNPGAYQNTAFHEVGKLLDLAPATVFDIWKARRT